LTVSLFFLLSKYNQTIKNPNNLQTYNSYLAEVRKLGAKRSYEQLKKDYPNNDPAAHDKAHVVGFELFEEEGSKGLSVCDEAFSYGCYHGFIDHFLIKNGLGKIKEVERDCEVLGEVTAPSCLHGIGHGVMNWEHTNIQKALSDCDQLGEKARSFCYDGVFMENNFSTFSLKKRVLTETNLNSPCDIILEKYQKQCYRNQVYLWMNYFKGEASLVAEQCTKIPEEFQETCFENFGISLAQNFQTNLNEIKKNCSQIQNSSFQDNCYLGSLKELMFEGRDPKVVIKICDLANNKEGCKRGFEQLLAEYKLRFKKS
jgi:hypothetical protein